MFLKDSLAFKYHTVVLHKHIDMYNVKGLDLKHNLAWLEISNGKYGGPQKDRLFVLVSEDLLFIHRIRTGYVPAS